MLLRAVTVCSAIAHTNRTCRSHKTIRWDENDKLSDTRLEKKIESSYNFILLAFVRWRFQLTLPSNTVLLVEVIDLRVQDSTATSGSCGDWLYFYDAQTGTYQQWCGSSNWTRVSPLYVDSWSVSGGASSLGTRTIDIAFATPSTTTGAALWISIYGRYLWYL